MSNFVVLVVGDDIEDQLQPYHEYECTGDNDEYVQDVDITEEVINNCKISIKKGNYSTVAEFLANNYANKTVYSEEEIDIYGEHAYHYIVAKKTENGVEIVKAIKRTNPNAKWDWWVTGGSLVRLKNCNRWSKGFLLKDGTFSDTALKKDIDIDKIIENSRQNAKHNWESYHEICGDIKGQYKAYKDFVEKETAKYPENERDIKQISNTALKNYWKQECIAKLQNAELQKLHIFFEVELITLTLDQYVELHQYSDIAKWAYIDNNHEWQEQGNLVRIVDENNINNMNWWCSNIDTYESSLRYRNKFMEFFKGLDDDDQITMLDCHI